MSASDSAPSSEDLRARWLVELVALAGESGWTDSNAALAATRAGLDAGEQALAAPGGIPDLIAAFFDRAEQITAAALAELDLSALRTHERVSTGVRTWLAVLAPDRAAVKRAAGRGLMPYGAGAAAARTWRVADLIWTAAGDTSADYNRYSKRGLLAACLPGLVFYWLQAPSQAALDAEIDRRLSFASQTGRSLGRLAKPVLDLFSTRKTPPPQSPFGA